MGELAAFATAVCWTVTVMSFEAAGRRVGSLPVNFIRLVVALVFLSLYSILFRGLVIPVDAPGSAWLWLSISGVVGFVAGDLCLFRAFVLIGSRITMVLFALVPPITALTGWMVLGEVLSTEAILGMMVTVSGISMVILTRSTGAIRLAHPLGGIILATLGAVCQAVGLVLSKHGMQGFDAFASTQIRIMAAIAAFVLLLPLLGMTGRVRSALSNASAMRFVTAGAFFGPFLGVSLSLVAISLVETGVASTIMALVPVLAIPPDILIMKRKVRLMEILGAVVAISGVALLSFGR